MRAADAGASSSSELSELSSSSELSELSSSSLFELSLELSSPPTVMRRRSSLSAAGVIVGVALVI